MGRGLGVQDAEKERAATETRPISGEQKNRKPQPNGCLAEPSHYNLATRESRSRKSVQVDLKRNTSP